MIFPDQKRLSVGVFKVRIAALGPPKRITGRIFGLINDFIEAKKNSQLRITTNQKLLNPSHGPLKKSFS
jgi:hypothetical protein